MSGKYFGKISKLVSEPSKVKYIPSFLKQEFALWKGRKRGEVKGESCEFVITSLSEYDRVNGFKNEKEIIEEIMEEVDEETVFYDIGANIGTHSCFVGKAGTKVYAFEPFPKNAESLKKNFELNNINGEVFEVALMNENSEMMLEEESGEAGEGKVNISDKGDLKTQVYRGDNFIENEGLEEPDVIKIDVEGAELEVLKGLRNVLEGSSSLTIFLETHRTRIEQFGGTVEELIDLLKKNFEVEKIDNRNKESHLKAIKPQ